MPGFRLWWGLLACAFMMLLILLAAPYSAQIQLAPDQGDSWYYWQLANANALTRLSAWGSYTLHQLSIWWLIYYAQTRGLKTASTLHPVNIVALTVNGIFVLWHIVQTRLFYDGLAQDVSIFSSLGSVAIMLMLVVVMENQRRGVVLGKKLSMLTETGRFLRKYHGYYFSWAVIYTFWYHPIETTPGHLVGVFYVLMLLLQGSLFLTRYHVNRRWTTFLEVFVICHAVVVARLSLENHAWDQFAFGFLALFVITQMHGLGLGARSRWLLGSLFLLAALLYYGATDWSEIGGVVQIPLIYLVGIALLVAIISAGRAVFRRLYSTKEAP